MKWARCDPSMIYEIGENLRKEDQTEVKLSHGLTGLEACEQCYLASNVIQAIEGDDGDPVGITGVVGNSIWLLGTEKLTSTKHHRWQLSLYGREWVEYCMETAGGMVENYVYSKNKLSIRWLKHLGFNIEAPKPYGVAEEMFCHFWRKS